MLKFVLRPSQGFRHKLGFAKPLGLGSVRIDPVATFLVDRRHRYGEDTRLLRGGGTQRYAAVERWPLEAESGPYTDPEEQPAATKPVDDGFGAGIFDDQPSDEPQSAQPPAECEAGVDLLPEQYRAENAALTDLVDGHVTRVPWSADGRSPYADCVSDRFWKQLEVLGNPHYVERLRRREAILSYPLKSYQRSDWQAGKDVESFKWFVGGGGAARALHALETTTQENLTLQQLAERLLLSMD